MLYDVIIIGGGVSGLSAAYALTKKGQRVLVVERGKHIFERQRTDMLDVANGIGGAGLFSDGKLSMYPSATNLWKLRKGDLEEAYNEVKSLLKKVGANINNFSEDWITNDMPISGVHKDYESSLMNIEQRMKLIFMFYQIIGTDHILVNSTVTKIERANGLYHIDINSIRKKIVHQANTIIIAGGKHCYQKLMQKTKGVNFDNKNYKLEIGFRIECTNDDFDYYNHSQMDLKLIEEKDERTIRTFCCCRDGVILESSSYDIRSLNGSSSDLGKTGLTNIGVLVRAEDKEGKSLRKVLGEDFFKQEKQKICLNDYMSGRSSILGPETDSLVRDFLSEHFPKMSKGKGVLFYPSIEKDGYYPELNDVLQMPSEDIWVVGDATGAFRGLTSSLVSGMLAANYISKKLLSYEKELRERLHIKVSDTKAKKVVFTAQSKQYFYCRDAVCEYVLRQGCIPVNPFRIFDYFLGDRVDRDLIRNGNNEMIKRCDELWVFGNVSDGVLFEVYMCRQMGKVVRFFNIATRASEIEELKPEDINFEPEIHSYQIKKDELLALVGNKNGMPPVVQLELNWNE
jgi:hypothetical protein